MIYNDLNMIFQLENSVIEIYKITDERIRDPYPLHSHGKDCYEIHIVVSGHGVLQTEKSAYDIEPETYYVTGPYISHAQFPKDEELREYGVYFSMIHNKKLKKGQIEEILLSHPFVIAKDQGNLRNLFGNMLEELEGQQIGYQENVMSYIRSAIVQLVRLILNESSYEDQSSARKSSTLHYNMIHAGCDGESRIKQHLMIDNIFIAGYKDVTLDSLASELGLSIRQTERLIRKEYGKTFMEKKHESRMSAAKVMLSDNSYSISEIAEHLGYSSLEHFSTAFKKYNQMTAREYRKNTRVKKNLEL